MTATTAPRTTQLDPTQPGIVVKPGGKRGTRQGGAFLSELWAVTLSVAVESAPATVAVKGRFITEVWTTTTHDIDVTADYRVRQFVRA